MDEVRYCEKCGYVGHVLFNKKCKNCKIKMKILPEERKNLEKIAEGNKNIIFLTRVGQR